MSGRVGFWAMWRSTRPHRKTGRIRLEVAGAPGVGVLFVPPVNARAFRTAFDRAGAADRRRLALDFVRRHAAVLPANVWRGPYDERLAKLPPDELDRVATALRDAVVQLLMPTEDDPNE